MVEPSHSPSHRQLLSRAQAPEMGGRRIDAIIVPSARSAPYLRHAAGLAEGLGATLVVLCSPHPRGRARARDIVADLSDRYPLVGLVAVDMPPALDHPMPRFETSKMLAGTRFERRTDTSLKRNLGLLLARSVGWHRVVFLDDDIHVEDPADLCRAVSLLDRHYAVGLSVGGYPDNSVVCHAHRDTGGWQETFVGGGALAVRADRVESFFPNVYNEDWLFLLDDVRLRPVAETGTAKQQPYDPFANPERARGEEFGDDLAEGVFALLDRGGRVQDADEQYWRGFLAARGKLILDIIERTKKLDDMEPGQRQRMLASLRAAYGRLQCAPPDLFVRYLRAWRADGTRWRRCLAELPTDLSVEKALVHLGLAGRYTTRWSEIRPAGPGDLSHLLSALGQEHYFADRLDRQAAGRGVLLVALIDSRPVGHVYLSLEPAEEEDLRRYLPGVPLLCHLEVLPELRSRGIGSAIMTTAEAELRRRGHRMVVLGVDLDNHRAAELYHRLRYRPWAYGPVETTREVVRPDGRTERVPDKCRIFVKKLSG